MGVLHTRETLSVRLDAATRQILAEAAPTHDIAGASALARDILERCAAERRRIQMYQSVKRAGDYIAAHPEGWDDDPADFFPGISAAR